MAKKDTVLSKISDEKHELEMTPMIDVTFLLLIFFMCTLKFKVLEGKLGAYLPKDVGAQSIEQEQIEKFKIQLRVINPGTKQRFDKELGDMRDATQEELDAGLRFEWGPDRVIEYTMGSYPTRSLAEVAKQVKQVHKAALAAGEENGARVELDPRQRTTNKDVVEVLDVVLDAGVTQVNFSGSYEQ